MAHKYVLEAVDRMLKDKVNDRKPMGGITLLLSGDFRQILPVVRRGSKADHINACLKTSILWKYIEKLTLKKTCVYMYQQIKIQSRFNKIYYILEMGY